MNLTCVRVPALSALFAAAAVWLPAVNAAAQDCASDTDCGAGYRCATQSYQSCGGSISCTPDGECTETEGPCSTVSYTYCTNANCEADVDCPSTMACQAQTMWQCSGGGSAGAGGAVGGSGGAVGGGSADDGMEQPVDGGVAGEPYECVEVPADSVCIPRHQLPCTVSSDCGGGFDCVQSTGWECSGSGSAGAGAADAGSPMPPPVSSGGASGGMTPAGDDAADGGGVGGGDYECHEVPGTEFYCQLQDLPCAADAECPDGLECEDQYVWMCDGSTTAGAGGGSSPTAGAGGGTPRPPSAPEDSDTDAGVGEGSTCSSLLQQRCMPPGWGNGPGVPGDGTGSGGSGSSADGGVDDSENGGAAGAGASGAGGAGGASGGDSDESGEDEDDDHGHGHGNHGNHFGWLKLGCSAGGPIGSDPSGWLALGMAVLVLRRRARKLS